MNNSPLELLAERYDNKVLYDGDGNPSIFVKRNKVKSNFFDASLPDHTHPAFIVNGTEDDYELYGKYKASELKPNGTLYSLPNMPPRVTLGHDPFRTRMNSFGGNVTGMTIADHGLLLLEAHKYGYVPKGNNSYGVDYRDGSRYELNKAVTVGTKRVFRGWEYECLIAHTTSAELLPSETPTHWKKGKHIGGEPVKEQYKADNAYNGYNTLTGSGPSSWYLNNDVGDMADPQGNCTEQVYGFRLVNLEIQIIPDNNAADPACDTTANSAAWKAILPHQSDDGYDLVEPGTAGTVHYAWMNGKVTLTARTLDDEEFDGQQRNTPFKDMAVDSATMPYVPYILKELGLAPIAGTTVQGNFYIQMTKDERVGRRSGSCNNTSYAGMAYLHCNAPRSHAYAYYGGRPRSRPET
ncbi:MAG: hypothetical protein IJ523_10640 [Succinivibrionaceae bacterium]|nr:hypothetical protein [Succinivibrionaceae bacterium]